MSPRRLTVDMARTMDFKDLAEAVYGMLAEFEAPEGDEIVQQLEARINRTLDRCPDVHSWILTLHAYFDHWTDGFKEQFGQTSIEYKTMRQKRDLCDNAARAARLRYEGASRRVTQLQRHEEGSAMRGHR